MRKLSQRAAEATQQIRNLVTTSSDQVREGTRRVRKTGQTSDRIVDALVE